MRQSIVTGAFVAAVLTVAACDAPTSQAPVDGAVFVVGSVQVDPGALTGVDGRQIAIAPTTIANDVQAALRQRLVRGTAPNADLEVTLQSVRLTSPAAAFALGGPSAITGIVTVRAAGSGEVIFGPLQVRGRSETVRLPGVIGAATSPSVERDYDQTVAGFAATVESLLSSGGTPG